MNHYYKIIFIIILSIIGVGSVSATYTTGLYMEYDFCNPTANMVIDNKGNLNANKSGNVDFLTDQPYFAGCGIDVNASTAGTDRVVPGTGLADCSFIEGQSAYTVQHLVWVERASVTSVETIHDFFGAGDMIWLTRTSGKWYLRAIDGAGETTGGEYGTVKIGQWVVLTTVWNGSNGNVYYYENKTLLWTDGAETSTPVSASLTGCALYGDAGASRDSLDGKSGGFRFWRRALSSVEVGESVDNLLTPYSPSLLITNSTINMTSDGGCNVWGTDRTNTCNTTDGTPEVKFTINYPANCSIRTEAGDYNVSHKCGTTDTTNQICSTLDVLAFGLASLYIDCEGGGLAAYDTGAMSINMTAGSSGGASLTSCIRTIGNGCGAVIENSCAVIYST